MDHLLSMEFNLLETYYVLTIQFEYINFCLVLRDHFSFFVKRSLKQLFFENLIMW